MNIRCVPTRVHFMYMFSLSFISGQVCTQTISLEECNALLASEQKQFYIVLRVFCNHVEHYGTCAVPDRDVTCRKFPPALRRVGRLSSLANYTLVYPLVTHEV